MTIGFISRKVLGFSAVILFLMSSPFIALAWQSQLGSGLFVAQCHDTDMQFLQEGHPVAKVSRTQIAIPLSIAIASQQNQPIAGANGVAVWALKSNEIQIHIDSDPDGTKLIIRADTCGPIFPISDSQPGQAYVYAYVSGSGRAGAFAQADSPGSALAYAYVANYPGTTGQPGNVYVVRRGDNLFRIALRYNTTVNTLVAVNKLSNPALIYAGQTLHIP